MQLELVKSKNQSELESMSKDDLIAYVQAMQQSNQYLSKVVTAIEKKKFLDAKDEQVNFSGELLFLRKKVYGRSSEKRPEILDIELAKKENPKLSAKKVLPSLRYENLPLIEVSIGLSTMPACGVCGKQMRDMGDQTENSEQITVTKKMYQVIRHKRKKYRCDCQGCIKTAPLPERIKPGSVYSDDFMLDVAISKYFDLIPVERYAKIAEREGLTDVPANSLIECTHHVANFLKPLGAVLLKSVQDEDVLYADETPHKMLEGHEKNSWQLWGFFSETVSYYLADPSRGASVAKSFLKNCNASYLVSDAYSGYNSASEQLKLETGKIIKHSYCNAHARRYFINAEVDFLNESKIVIDFYKKIYQIESEIKGLPLEDMKARRANESKVYWKELKKYLIQIAPMVLEKSALGKAVGYWFNHEKQLAEFLDNPNLPIDNNLSERQLRGPVVGRKTWYGNHSVRGSKTSTQLFSIMQTCKMNKVNPYDYLKNVIQDIHNGKTPITPSDYKKI